MSENETVDNVTPEPGVDETQSVPLADEPGLPGDEDDGLNEHEGAVADRDPVAAAEDDGELPAPATEAVYELHAPVAEAGPDLDEPEVESLTEADLNHEEAWSRVLGTVVIGGHGYTLFQSQTVTGFTVAAPASFRGPVRRVWPSEGGWTFECPSED